MSKPEKPKEEGAPLYMGQYSSLMTILLAFFISMLTMTKDSVRTAEFKQGFGMVQTAFSFEAGIGLLRFVKSLMPYRPEVEEESEGDDKFYQAYTKGTFQNRRFDYNYIDKLELRYLKQVVKVAVPIVFAPASTDINAEGLVFLDRLAAVLRNMPDRSFTIACYCSTGAGTADQELAARRAAAIVRYLEENGKVLRDCLLPVGYSETRYLGDIQMAESGQATLLFISGKALNIEEL